jgi:AAA domain
MLNQEQAAIKELVLAGRSVCICSPAGVGKTYLLQDIVESMRELGYTVMPCAFTGAASSNYEDGTTVHSSSHLGIGVNTVLPETIEREPLAWQGHKRRSIKACTASADPRWKEPRLVCVIDEFYQLSSEDARLWWAVGKCIRASLKLPDPIYIFAGDIGQFLPPSGSLAFETAKFQYYDEGGKLTTIEFPSILDEIAPTYFHLTENMRQRDEISRKVLNWLYYGIAVHPYLVSRLELQPPDDIPTYYYNRILVAQENAKTLEPFLKNQTKVYQANGQALTTKEVVQLLPVEVETKVHVDAPFTIVTNYRDAKGDLIVANGELVTVVGFQTNAITVKTARNEVVTLAQIKHHLSYDPKLKRAKTFYQLPGYSGKARSLYKMQGSTLTTASKFAVWQLYSTGRVSHLGNIPGALYVICSRPTSLDLLYFDTSLNDKDLTLKYLKQSLKVDPRVLKFILNGRKPWWYSDKSNVIEILSQLETNVTNMYALQHLHTNLIDGTETKFTACYYQTHGGYFRYSGINEPKFALFEKALETLANNWFSNKSLQTV